MDFSKNVRARYAELQHKSKSSSKLSLNSLDRIAEFRRKLESSFASNYDLKSSQISDQPLYSPKFSSTPHRPSFPSVSHTRVLSKGSAVSSIASHSKKSKINEILSIETLMEAKQAILSATEDEIRDMPYMYSFTLNKFCTACEKFENI